MPPPRPPTAAPPPAPHLHSLPAPPQDVGPKQGLNGVDNGRIWFRQLRVPKSALLDAYASIDDEGQYVSSVEEPRRRFGATVGGLTTGRCAAACSACCDVAAVA